MVSTEERIKALATYLGVEEDEITEGYRDDIFEVNGEEYLVLDDDESLFPYPERINLYLTNYKTGITESDIRKLKKICKGR